MSPSEKTFYIRFGHFLSGMFLMQLFGLVTFPILTRVLTKEQYGILGLVTTTMLFAVAVSKAGLSDAIVRFYKEYKEIPEKIILFSSTVIIRGLTLAIITASVYIMIFPIMNRSLRIDDKYISSFMIMGIYLFIRPLNLIVLNFLKVTGKSLFMSIIGIIDKVISVTLSLFLLMFIFNEIYGYFIGIILSEFIVSLVLFFWFFKNYKIVPSSVSKDLTIKFFKFGVPLFLSEFCFLLLSYADRYIIIAFYGEAALGLYSVGYNLAMYVTNIIMFSLSYAIVPIYVEIYESDGKDKTEEFLNKCAYYLIIIIIPMCFGYIAISKDLFITLATEKYLAAATFSPIILIGSFFLVMNTIFNAGLFLQKRTMTLMLIIIFAIILNIITNFILLPKIGLLGAALATLVSCITTTILTVLLSFRYISIKIDIKTLLFYIILSGVMFIILEYIEFKTAWINLLIKIIAGIFIIGIGILYRESNILGIIKNKLQIKNNEIIKILKLINK